MPWATFKMPWATFTYEERTRIEFLSPSATAQT
jgi:hypothetical protein